MRSNREKNDRDSDRSSEGERAIRPIRQLRNVFVPLPNADAGNRVAGLEWSGVAGLEVWSLSGLEQVWSGPRAAAQRTAGDDRPVGGKSHTVRKRSSL